MDGNIWRKFEEIFEKVNLKKLIETIFTENLGIFSQNFQKITKIFEETLHDIKTNFEKIKNKIFCYIWKNAELI